MNLAESLTFLRSARSEILEPTVQRTWTSHWEQMRRNFFSSNSKQAGIIAKYYSPDIAFEQGLRSTVKCASIVEEHGKKLPLLSRVQVKFNVDAIFGNLLWRQINKSRCFCIHLTAWLFLHWRRLDDIKGERRTLLTHVTGLLFVCRIQNTL